jgi:hypothetical protein
MKAIKKILIIIPSVIFGIFLILLLTPILFKGKILEIAKKEINNMLTAKVDFSDLKLSFIRNFPDAYIALEDVSVICTGEFEGETLAAFKVFSVTVDIMSVIKMDNIKVKSILLDHPQANAHIAESGNTNWNIMKAKEEVPPEGVPPEEKPVEKPPEAASEKSPLKIALNKFEIRKAALSFQDDASKLKAKVGALDFLLSGDMTLDTVDLNLKLGIEDVDFYLGGVRMLNRAQIGLVSGIAADFKNMVFTLKDNRFNINDFILKFAGSVKMPGDMDFDMTFAADKTDFKSVLALVPAVYMKDFEKIKTTGSFKFAGSIKGIFNNKQMPSANVDLSIDNAMFKYPDLPKSVDNINVKINAYYDGAVFDKTTLDVDKLHFEMANNPFDAEVHVKTPQSDMQVMAKFKGKIDFNSLAEIVPLDDMTIKGLLDCDFSLAGRMSTIEKQRYEDFDARGVLKLSGVDFRTASFQHPIKIASTRLDLSPRKVDLSDFNAVIGSSDIALNGSLENFIPYVFKGSTVRGALSLKSKNINLNEFMGPKDEEKKPKEPEKPEDSTPMSVIEVPGNIDFAVKIDIANLLFDKLKVTNTLGSILVKDSKVHMQNLSLNTLDGKIVLTGDYSTKDIKAPSVNFSANISRVNVESAIKSFDILQKILPKAENYAGKVSANLVLASKLDEHMSPVLDTVDSKGQLQTHDLKIKNSELFGKMADLLKNETWRTPTLNNINVKYVIKNGRLTIDPLKFNIAQTALELTGGQGLDMTLGYKVNATVPVSSIGAGATSVLGNIPGGSRIKEIKVTGLIGGTVTKPAVTLSAADMVGSVAEVAKEVVKEQAQVIISKSKEEIEKQVATLMAEAEKQAQTIRATAKAAADRTRSESNSAADQLESRAKTPLEKAAAKPAADKLRSEGRTKAATMEQEADKQATAILDAAKKKADELRKQ